MAETNRRYAYNNNRLFIEEIPNSPPTIQSPTSRQTLPAINQSQQLVPFNSNNKPVGNEFNSASLDLNNTQNHIKTLENRIQQTEVNNRALLEELVRLQNELALSLRRSFDSLQEERTARQILENSYKFQTESFIQLNGRLKRAEDSLSEDRVAMQSLIAYTKSLEQANINVQTDVNTKKDYQFQRLEGLKFQIDDLQNSKENLERNAYALIEQIKTLKSQVDMESLNVNTISGDLRNKTRRLEEENRHQLDTLRKHQESMANTENNIQAVKSQLENKISEIRDLSMDARNKIEYEKTDKRNLEQNLTVKFSEFQSMINEEKHKYNEALRSLESLRREFTQSIEAERARSNAFMNESKESSILAYNDKIEKTKEDLLSKFRDVERSHSDEVDQRMKFQQSIKETTDYKLDNIKRLFEEELKMTKEETKENLNRINESVRKLNDGLDLTEKKCEERTRQLEKVTSAEIKTRKVNEKESEEKLNGVNEKFTYAMQSFQTTLGNMSTKINEQNTLFVSKLQYVTLENNHERLKGEVNRADLEVNTIRDNLTHHQAQFDTQVRKMKEVSDSVFNIDQVQIPTLNSQLANLATKDELNRHKLHTEQEVLDATKKAIDNNANTIDRNRKEMDSKIEALKTELNSNKQTVDFQKLESDLISINKLQASMSEEIDVLDADQKNLADKVKKIQSEMKNKPDEDVSLRMNELEEKSNKLSEQVITEQIKTRMQIDEIKDEMDDMEKKLNKQKESWKTAVDPLEVEIKRVQNDTEELKVWRLNLNQELDDLEKDQKKLKNESDDVKKLKDDMEELNDWRVNLVEEIDELEKDQKSFIRKWESKNS